MSERKVLAKYYPPDFDPSLVGRSRGPKQVGPKVSTVRLMSPFSMKCTTCGEFIYRGRKFNARKEIPIDEKYLNIQIFRFYIRCTRCSGEIVFKTDPRNQDYTVEKGAKRNVDPWKRGLGGGNGTADETDEQRLDRIEREMAAAEGDETMVLMEEKNAMAELEAKTADAKREMAVADALDEIRSRNARLAKAQREGVEIEAVIAGPSEEEERRRRREEEEDAEAARRAFAFARTQTMLEEPIEEEGMEVDHDDDDAVLANGGGGGGSSSSSRSISSNTGGGGGGDGGGSKPGVAGFVASPPSSTSPSDAAEPKPEPVAPKPATVVKKAADIPPPPTFERKVKKKKDHAALLGIKKKPSLV